VLETIRQDPYISDLVGKLASGNGPVQVSGLWGSSAPMVAAAAHDLTGRTLVYITAHLAQADAAREDVEFFLGRSCELLSAWESLPGEGPASTEIQAERMRLCGRLIDQVAGQQPVILTAPIQALMQPVPDPKALEAANVRLAVGAEIDPDNLLPRLLEAAFERLELIEAPGDVARRGSILDVFAPGDTHPVRIEFDGDRVDALRRFDPYTQRSFERPDRVVIQVPDDDIQHAAARTTFLNYLPDDAVLVLDSPAEVQEMGQTILRRTGDPDRLFDVHAVLAGVDRFTSMYLSRFAGPARSADQHVAFQVGSLARFEGSAARAVGELVELARDRHVTVICENDGEKRRLSELIDEAGGAPHSAIEMRIGYLHRGFEWRSTRQVFVAHHEIFNRTRPRRRIRRAEAVRPIESWLELSRGDYVVHAAHGIARFREMKTMRKGDSAKVEEFLSLEFASKTVLHVPVSDIDLVQKYVGTGGGRPRLSRLGGTRWSRTKERVGEAVAELAEALIRVQAARQIGSGTAYPDDTEWQREFEDAFPYQETEDQLLVADEIKEDLRRHRPMDRLLCGDVGYGKTELAMRAAFKVAEFGKQVAVLVPTTVLAEQHYRTFRERIAEYPFIVGCLSRFRTGAEQRRMIEAVRKGQIDVIIGTHRLLSKDVKFADLGLVIIDEEQRFGVEHKERLKQLRDTVEVLTMTATPIPRTLHMSMVGLRDISSLATPPVDRRSIATQVSGFDAGLIRDAIVREINRDGQVFFVHNHVRSIEAMAQQIQSIVPQARVVFGHGQMHEHELERVMQAFVDRQADVLVATTIIESGIDIPTANTIFINNADRFGLADLHQLRGRVGRSEHRAYCYLLVSRDRPVEDKASRRLKAIEEFSELGAGFQIAMRDLEIRGAGNLLGPEQSGHIAAVGYDMYCRLLQRAVQRLRDEPEPLDTPVHLELGVEAFIPERFVPSTRARIDVYRRTVACRTPDDLDRLQSDLEDAYGRMPRPVRTLLDLAELRVLARSWRILSIKAESPDIVFTIADLALVQALFADAPGTVRSPDPQTVHLRLRPAYFEPPTLLATLRRLLSREPAAQAQEAEASAARSRS